MSAFPHRQYFHKQIVMLQVLACSIERAKESCVVHNCSVTQNKMISSHILFIRCLLDAIQAATKGTRWCSREGKALFSKDKKAILTMTAHGLLSGELVKYSSCLQEMDYIHYLNLLHFLRSSLKFFLSAVSILKRKISNFRLLCLYVPGFSNKIHSVSIQLSLQQALKFTINVINRWMLL